MMEDFADFGMFSTNTNVNNEMGTLQSPDLMREVVSRLNLNMDYHTDGRFHRQTVYGEQLPVKAILLDFPANQAAAFTMQLKDRNVTLSDFQRDGEEMDGTATGILNDTISSPIGKIMIQPASSYEQEKKRFYMFHMPLCRVPQRSIRRVWACRKTMKSQYHHPYLPGCFHAACGGCAEHIDSCLQ